MGLLESVEAARAACAQLISNAQRELELMSDLREYLIVSNELMTQLAANTAALAGHQPIEAQPSPVLVLRRRN